MDVALVISTKAIQNTHDIHILNLTVEPSCYRTAQQSASSVKALTPSWKLNLSQLRSYKGTTPSDVQEGKQGRRGVEDATSGYY